MSEQPYQQHEPPAAIPAAPKGDQEIPWSGLAIAGFVLSIAGFVVPFASLTAIVLSSVALSATAGGKKRGRALAGIGLGLGILSAGIGAYYGAMSAM
jgi:4-amino-4-deoxy-L-arabinose transferase-like glycosyltransferase